MRESKIEEIFRTNIDMLCDDEESMIIGWAASSK